MNAYFCSVYDGSGSVWPKQPFPGNLFHSWNFQRRLDAQVAWNFFEEVESSDAQVRVKLAGGWVPPPTSAFATTPSLWYPLFSEGRMTLYRKGLALHKQACPNTNWTPQRMQNFSTNVVPGPI